MKATVDPKLPKPGLSCKCGRPAEYLLEMSEEDRYQLICGEHMMHLIQRWRLPAGVTRHWHIGDLINRIYSAWLYRVPCVEAFLSQYHEVST